MNGTAVAQHIAIWDVGGGSGWVSLYSPRRRRLVRREVADLVDFRALLTMLAEEGPVWFDGDSELIRHADAGGAMRIDRDARR